MNDPDVDDLPPSAAEAQRLIHEQRALTSRSISPDPRLVYWPWSIAWLVGFGCLYLRFGPDDQVLVPMPEWLPLTVLYVMMAAALVVSGVSGARHARHIKGDSQFKGATYGFAWFLGFAGIGVAAGRVSNLLPPAETGLLWAGLSVALVAAMYLAGGALWGDRDMVILGVWVGVVNVVGILIGPGWHSLIIATAGAAGGLVAGQVAARRRNRCA